MTNQRFIHFFVLSLLLVSIVQGFGYRLLIAGLSLVPCTLLIICSYNKRYAFYKSCLYMGIVLIITLSGL